MYLYVFVFICTYHNMDMSCESGNGIPHYRREFSMSTKRRMSKLRTASIPSGALIVKRCRYLPCRDTYYLRWMVSSLIRFCLRCLFIVFTNTTNHSLFKLNVNYRSHSHFMKQNLDLLQLEHTCM